MEPVARQLSFSVMVLLSLCGMIACAQPPPPAAPPVFRITLSRAGGFTGMATGYHLQSDGTLIAWRRALAQEEQVNWTHKYAPDEVRRWAEDLQGAVHGWQSGETGNMTTRLEFARDDSVRAWTWAGTGAPAQAPKAVGEWLQEFDRFAREAAAK